MNSFEKSFTHYPSLDIPKELVGNEHLVNTLGNEPGYRRLESGELVQEGDETFGVFGNPWELANKYQIGKPANKVGGFATWRRKL